MYPSFLGAVSDKYGKVNGLNHATECIDGDKKHFSGLHIGIKDPKHCTEECSHIWN